MAVLKYKDSSGNWIEVGSNTEASGGGKLYRHIVTFNDGLGGTYLYFYSSKNTPYTQEEFFNENNIKIIAPNITNGIYHLSNDNIVVKTAYAGSGSKYSLTLFSGIVQSDGTHFLQSLLGSSDVVGPTFTDTVNEV